jgi:lysophospholipase L1-like esterase
MAKAYGFETYFFWQPVLAYGDKPLTPFEQQLKEARSQEFGGEVHRGLKAVYEQAESRSTSGKFVFLGHAFDEVQELVYVDEFHLDPLGNEMIARAIAQTVKTKLAE